MFIPQTNTLFVEVPKNGSRTLVNAAKKEFGNVLVPGHKPLSYVLDWLDRKNHKIRNIKVCAIYREPFSRFLSGLNYCAGRHSNYTIDKAITELQKPDGKRDTVYNSQSFYLDVDKVAEHYEGFCPEVRLFKMSEIDLATFFVGYTGEPLYFNKSSTHFTLSDIKNLETLIQKVYSEDYELTEKPSFTFF